MAGIEIGAGRGAAAVVALPAEAEAAFARLDRRVPRMVRRSDALDRSTGSRSLELTGVVDVDGGVFLSIPGLGAPLDSAKPRIVMGVGAVAIVLANAALAAMEMSSLPRHLFVSALVLSPFIGWNYRTRATEGNIADPVVGLAVGIFALDDFLVFRYASMTRVIPRETVRGVSTRKKKNSSGSRHVLYTYELVLDTVGLNGQPMELVPWRLVEHASTVSAGLTTYVTTMPAIAEYLQTTWLGEQTLTRGDTD